MARGPIKGKLPQKPASPTSTVVVPLARKRRPIPARVLLGFDPAEFEACPIITNHVAAIHRKFFAGCMPATKGKNRSLLLWFASVVEAYSRVTGRIVDRPQKIDSDFASFVYLHIQKENRRSAKTSLVNRLIDCLGVSKEFHLPNLWQSDVSDDIKEALDDQTIRQLLKQAKSEAREIIRRADEAARHNYGCDPRIAGGGRWGILANRLWAIKNILELRVMTWGETNREFPTICKALQRNLGAVSIAADGKLERKTGLVAHLRYFYPGGRDLAPFIVLLMLRTSFNLSTVARLKHGQWQRTYPFAPPAGSKNGVCYVEGPKSRGKQNRHDPDKIVRAISLMRPWSHPYKILKFVERLTKESRREIKRQIKLLKGLPSLDEKQRILLKEYQSIKDHIFLYHVDGRFHSLWNERGNTPGFLMEAMTSYGAPSSVRLLRDAGLTFALAAPGGNTAILQLLASHDQRIIAYERRKQTLAAAERAMKAIFEQSLVLIRKGRFSIGEIKRGLKVQGFSVSQIENLIDPDITSIWGNGCADPTAPPPDFSEGTKPGNVCSGQRCIDGCPWARWFPPSIPFIKRLHKEREDELAELGLEATLGSSHDHRLAGLTQLLRSWPPEILRAYED